MINVLPRDLKPGDVIDRVNSDLDVVPATIVRVQKIRQFERTVYRVYLDQSSIPESQLGWAEHRHLSPFILQPRRLVTVRNREA